jgi:hypothetical protein
VSGSVGISLYPEDGRDPQTLMKNADTAMFHGKGVGKNTYQYFTAQMNVAVKRRMTLESALRRAVMQKSFVLHYQPQVDLETGEIIAVEALVRWQTEDSASSCRATSSRSPRRPAHQRAGRVGAARGLPPGARVARSGPGRKRIAINLSARQFSDRGFLDMVTRVLAETGLDPTLLELEITESQVMRQTEGMISLLNAALRDGHAARDRRLRHRLLEPFVPEAPADPEAQDRPVRSCATSPSTRTTPPSWWRSSTWREASTSTPSPRASRPPASWRCCARRVATSGRATSSRRRWTRRRIYPLLKQPAPFRQP